MNYSRIFLIRFENDLSQSEIPSFRGAIVNILKDKDILFHNHLPEGAGFNYAYPLIQYKRINRKAALLCFGLGTEAIGKLFFDSDMELNINGKIEKFVVDNVKAYRHLIQIWETKFQYRLRKWLALNQENYEKYNQLESVS